MRKKSILCYLLLFISSFLFFNSSASAQSQKWQELSPPLTNTVYDFAVGQNNSIWVLANNVVYSSTDRGANWIKRTYISDSFSKRIAINPKGYIYTGGSGAVFRSTDNGQSWTRQRLDNYAAPVLAIKFNAAGQIIVVTGFSDDASYVYLSSDDGTTWTKQGTMPDEAEIHDLAITSSGKYVASTRKGIYSSANKGVSWTKVESILAQGAYYSVVANKGGNLFTGTQGKIYISKDEGKTWEISYMPSSQNYIKDMITDSSGTIWATTAFDLYKTSNNGQSWIRMSISYDGDQSLIFEQLASDQNNCLYGAGTGVAWSTDGSTWTQIGKGIDNSYVSGILATPSGRLFTYYPGKLYVSDNKGLSWAEGNLVLQGWAFNTLNMDPRGNLYAGGSGYYAFSTDNGDTWIQGTIGDLTPRIYNFAFDQDGKVYAGTNKGCFSTIDNGHTWVQLNNYSSPYNGLVAVHKSGSLFFATKDAVYRSTDKGLTWTKVTPNFSNEVNALLINRKGFIYFGTNNLGLFYSKDNGATWTQTTVVPNVGSSEIKDLAEAADGAIYASTSSSLYYSKNDGKDWIYYDSNEERLGKIDKMCLNKEGIMYTSSMGQGLYKSSQSMLKILPPEIDSIIPGPRNIKLAWTKNSSTEFQQYRIYVGVDHYPSTLVASINDVNQTIKLIDGLISNKRYYFVVSTVDKSGNESFTDEQSAVPLLPSVPPAAILAGITKGSINVTVTPVLKWNRYIYGDSYYLQLSTDSTFHTITFAASAITDTLKQVSPALANSTKYFWRVKTQNETGDGPWSEVWNFTTIIAAPQSPQCTFPLNNARDMAISQTLKWNRAATADTYHIQLSVDQNFSTYVLNDTTLADTLKTAPQLQNETKYYWRVRAKNIGGFGAWSGTQTFTTIVAAPTIPVVTYPNNKAVNITTDCTFKWVKSIKAEKYRFILATDSLFTDIVVDDSLIVDSLRRVNPLVNKTKYYWKVKAVNIGGESSWTAVWSFTTIVAAPTTAVELTEPYKNTTDLPVSLILKWKSVKEAEKYRLQISTLQNFATVVIDDSTLTDTLIQIGTLKNKTVYYWKVQAKNAGGLSPWSEIWNFTTIVSMPNVVQLTSPANNGRNIPKDTKLSWVQVQDAQTYRLQVSEDSLFTTKIIDDSTVTINSKDVTGLKTGVKYYWRVNAANIAGTGNYSPVWNFITLLPACEQFSADSVTAWYVKLRWEDKSDNETGFILERKSDKEAMFTIRATIKSNTTTYTDTATPNTTYRYRIKAYNQLTESNNSTELILTTPKQTSVEKTIEVPVEYALNQNYPNPFNPATVIKYSVLNESRVKLEVYNSIGALIEVLTNEVQPGGVYERTFNAEGLSSGIYYYTIKIQSVDGKDNYRSVKKMILIK